VANNWSKLFDSSNRVGGTKLDWSKEPDFDWRRVCGVRWPREKYPDRRAWEEDPWRQVPPNIMKTIHAEGEEILAKL
jgi:hypothetical protein